MRTLATIALCALTLVVASCSDSPTTTTDTGLGITTVEKIRENPAYKGWYETNYSAYPEASGQAKFVSSIQTIQTAFDPSVHSVVMAIKPNCGCQTTQLWLPRVMKALDAAGIPHEKLTIYVTDSRLNGVDETVKNNLHISAAPSFIVVKNGQVAGRIDTNPPVGRTVEEVLAEAFTKP